MRYAGRYVVETHAHISTLYKTVEAVNKNWQGVAEPFDNSAMCLYDMERYGIDMTFIKPPSQIGPTNDMHAQMVANNPDKFRAFCTDQTQKLKVAMGEAKWDLDASAAEVDAALATGNFIGIGEFVPRDWDPRKIYSFEERLNEFRVFMDLARKHKVTVDYHEFSGGHHWDHWKLLARLVAEYPDVPIIVCHTGWSASGYNDGDREFRKALSVAGGAWRNGVNNVYLETGTMPAELIRVVMDDPNVGVQQLIWGGDYGSRQYIVTPPGRDGDTYATFMRKWRLVAPYQVDWWGSSLHRIDKVRDFATQDEINLILGGNVARLYDLPLPHDRMFMQGRPDIWGIFSDIS